MDSHSYGLLVNTELTMEEAETAIRSALADQGFGILTEIDLAATLREKLGVERPGYRILGACNPALANQALQHEQAIGLLLPCNIAIYESDDHTVVAALEPELMATITDNSAVGDVAREAKQRIVAALSTLE